MRMTGMKANVIVIRNQLKKEDYEDACILGQSEVVIHMIVVVIPR